MTQKTSRRIPMNYDELLRSKEGGREKGEKGDIRIYWTQSSNDLDEIHYEELRWTNND